MPAADDLALFHDAVKATLIASGVLGKVRAELKLAALEAIRRQPPHDDDMDAPAAVGAHQLAAGDDAQALAHALVLDFLLSQPTLSRSASVFESEAGTERLPGRLRARDGLETAAGVAGSSPHEPLLVSLLRRPGGLGGAGSDAGTSPGASPTRMPVKRLTRQAAAPEPEEEEEEHQEEEEDEAGSDVASTPADSPEKAPSAGPSLSVAKAARWPVGGGRPGTISREASVEFSDATAEDGDSAEVGIDWDYVETSGGTQASSAAGPAVTVAAPAAAAPSRPAAASSSMHPPDDTESDDAEDDGGDRREQAPAIGTAAMRDKAGDKAGDDASDDEEDMYEFDGEDDDDDEF